MVRRKVCQSDSVFLTVLVACADCVNLSPPSPASGLAPCGWVLWGDPIPGWPEGASCRCAPLPAWPSQLVRQGPAGPPRFRASPCARATLSDPGRSAPALPVVASAVLGSVTVTSSPPALRLSRLNCFSGMRVPLAARACTWVRLSDGRSARWNHRSTGSCPSVEQPSVLGGWLDLSIHYFRSELQRLLPPNWGDFHPRSSTPSPSAPPLS